VGEDTLDEMCLSLLGITYPNFSDPFAPAAAPTP
jgi:hypothetical protein